MQSKVFHFIAAMVLVLVLPELAAAAVTPSIIPNAGVPGCDFAGGQIASGCVPNFIEHIVKFIFTLAGSFAILMIIISGFQIATAKVLGRDRSEGFTRLRVAIVGFILCAISWYIIDFIIRSLAFGF